MKNILNNNSDLLLWFYLLTTRTMEEAKKGFVGKPITINEQGLLEKRIKQLEEENIILKENIKIMKDIIVRLDKEVEVIKEKLDLDD